MRHSRTVLVDDCYNLWREDQLEQFGVRYPQGYGYSRFKEAKGYAIQICVLLKNVPGLELGESRAFPSSRILTEKTVHRYVVIKEKFGGEVLADAPRVKKTPVKKAASKKRPATDAAVEPVVKNKRTTKSKSVSVKEILEILPVAQEAVLLQMIAPTPVAPAEQPPVPKRTTQKRKRRLILGSDDEIVVSEPVFCGNIVGEAAVEVVDDTAEKDVETVFESVDEPVSLLAVVDVLNEGIITADDVDIIIEQVISETAQIQTDEGDKDVDASDVGEKTVEKADELEQWLNLSYEEFHAQQAGQTVVTASDTDEDMEIVEEMETEAVELSADEAMSLDDILMTIPVECPLPSANVEITPITLGTTISIPGVHEGDWYKAGLPKIPATDKVKEPLYERDPVKGNPIKEQFLLIVADINLLKLSVHIAASAFDTVDVRKEVKDINAKVTYLDGQVAEIRSEQLEFRAKIEENYLNLSTQLGLIIDYLRSGDAKKGESGSSRPQPPPDDQSRPSEGSGGSGNIPHEQRSGARESSSRGGSQRRGDRSGSSKRRLYSSGGGPLEDHLKIG
ncbi:hypothetical protein F511_37497 [Dorcoceras hygrometricum]|uniref:Uncharacterized protein n=1 Tax=Dorcoceras hygrometricum TaxID=472368 RepID=A0A2Z7BM21_9LAMI|nr:hypothetical protein F511_37497 [Dorcoceras hygrometricum]